MTAGNISSCHSSGVRETVRSQFVIFLKTGLIIGISVISGKCPGCGANLELPPESKPGLCEYCGSSFIVTVSGAYAETGAKSGKILKYYSDWAMRLKELIIERFLDEHKIDLSKDPIAMKRIAEASLKGAIELEAEGDVTINIPFIVQDFSNPLHICEEYNRSDMINTD